MNRAGTVTLALAAALAGCAVPAPKGVDPEISAPLAAGAQRKQPAAPSVEQAILPPLRIEMPQVGGRPIDGRFDLAVVDAPAAQVFNSLAAGTRYSMLVPAGVTGNISVNLKDVTLREALEAIRDLYGYEFRIDGTRILIQTAGVQTRVFQVNYLAAQRRGVSQVRVTSNALTDPSGTSGGGTGTSATTSSSSTGGASSGGVSGLLSAAGATGRESTRVITNQEATFWIDLCEALVALTFPDGGAASAAASAGSSIPEDRQRSACNRRHAQSDRALVVTPQSGVIVVRALPAELRSVENYLRATRVSVERQVMLEAKIIEVTLSNQFQSGVNWAVFGNNVNFGQVTPGAALSALPRSGAAGTALTGGGLTSNTGTSLAQAAGSTAQTAAASVFGLALQTSNFSALLSFLETQGNVQVLSSPRVAALNNQKAVLKVGDEQLFVSNISVTPTQNAATGVVTGAIATPQFTSYFSGIVLDVTPQIDDAGNITLHIHPSINDVSNQATPVNLGFGNVTVPTAKSTLRETDTIVRVTDGNIVAIGGLMRTEVNDQRSGLPGLMDSTLGWLFSSTSRLTQKKELVILLKSTIVDSDRVWADDLRETQQRLDALKPPARGMK